MFLPDSYLTAFAYWLDQERHHAALATLARASGEPDLEQEQRQLARLAESNARYMRRAMLQDTPTW